MTCFWRRSKAAAKFYEPLRSADNDSIVRTFLVQENILINNQIMKFHLINPVAISITIPIVHIRSNH